MAVELCSYCRKPAFVICPRCSRKMCKAHLKSRYAGPDRGLKSRWMCPRCNLLIENMRRANLPTKTYVHGRSHR